jgi:hypothetical protein
MGLVLNKGTHESSSSSLKKDNYTFAAERERERVLPD